jgi:TonB family protein
MFEGFSEKRASGVGRGRRVLSVLLAGGIYVGAGAVALALSKPELTPPDEKLIEVTLAQPPPAPPPPVAAAPRPRPVAARPQAPSVAPPAPEVVAPKEIPTEAPPTEGFGTPGLSTDVYGTEAGVAPAAASPAYAEPINLPEEATPPGASPDNRPPTYPESARAEGKESQVILKVVIDELGRVGRIEVMRGEAPFVDAAKRAVERWTYTPALLAGRPIAVFRIIKIPFRLSVAG